jgi:hypothetical protein
MRGGVLLAMGGALVMLAPLLAEARPRCKFGQIYRPSLRICQSKMTKRAQPYLKRTTTAPTAPKRPSSETSNATGAEPDEALEPLSTIPMLEPKAEGSLNPLPRWRAGPPFR